MGILDEIRTRKASAEASEDQGCYNAGYQYGFVAGAEYALERPYEVMLAKLPSLEEATERDVFCTNGDEILSRDEGKINALADLLDAMGYTAVTGFYDEVPESEPEDGLEGFFYVDI